jgi:hypothetical protein
MQPSILFTVPILVLIVLVYLKNVRPWQLRWGAADDEIKHACLGMTLFARLHSTQQEQ